METARKPKLGWHVQEVTSPLEAGNLALTHNVTSFAHVRRRLALGRLAALALLAWSGMSSGLLAADASPDPIAPIAPAINEERILGIMPNYQTVNDPNSWFVPLTKKQKWSLAFKETVDPFNIANVAIASGFSQIGDQTPKYGEGGGAYAMRFGAAFGDFATQNVFSAGLLATVLHQDPRYFRKGPGTGVAKRVGYSLSRLVVAKQDSGNSAFNASGIFGMVLGIAASNLYYPRQSIQAEVMLGRVQTSLLGGVIGNLTSEFWPDFQKTFHRHARNKTYLSEK